MFDSVRSSIKNREFLYRINDPHGIKRINPCKNEYFTGKIIAKNRNYLLPENLRMSKIARAMMAAMIKTPTHTPALKIPPTTSHEVKKNKNKESNKI